MVCPSSWVLRSWGSISGVVEASRSAQAAVFPLQRAAFRAWPNSYALVGWRLTEMSSPLQLFSEAGAADLSSSSSTWGRKIRSQRWTFPHAGTPSKITQACFKKSQAPCQAFLEILWTCLIKNIICWHTWYFTPAGRWVVFFYLNPWFYITDSTQVHQINIRGATDCPNFVMLPWLSLKQRHQLYTQLFLGGWARRPQS